MKKLSALIFFMFFSSLSLLAQTITISGFCVNPAVTLNRIADINGRPQYDGFGTVTGYPNTRITVKWLNTKNAWCLFFDGGGLFFTNSYNTSKPPKTGWIQVDTDPECINPPPLSLSGDGALWVTFDKVDAKIKENELWVSWQTMNELNNDHFNIEASQDGKEFKTIATVKSKAVNGNSETPITYEWHSDIGGSLAAIPFVALLLASFTSLRRNKVVMASILVLTIVAAGFSCSKTEGHLAGSKDGYIRIVQVDKDGTTSQSKVIKISSE